MYFEDIYDKVSPLWKREFSLEGILDTKTYVEDIRSDFNKIERIIDLTEADSYTEWHGVLNFSMYKTLTRFALKKWKDEDAKVIFFEDVPITSFEEVFRKSFEPEDEYEGNIDFLKQYEGFREPPNNS